jgi:hypothetical protein
VRNETCGIRLHPRRQRRGNRQPAGPEHGEKAKILAGGQSLMAMLNIRLAQPAMLVDISR